MTYAINRTKKFYIKVIKNLYFFKLFSLLNYFKKQLSIFKNSKFLRDRVLISDFIFFI